MKKNYQAPKVKAVKVQQTQMLCGSVKSAFSVSNDKLEEGSESDWSETNHTW